MRGNVTTAERLGASVDARESAQLADRLAGVGRVGQIELRDFRAGAAAVVSYARADDRNDVVGAAVGIDRGGREEAHPQAAEREVGVGETEAESEQRRLAVGVKPPVADLQPLGVMDLAVRSRPTVWGRQWAPGSRPTGRSPGACRSG